MLTLHAVRIELQDAGVVVICISEHSSKIIEASSYFIDFYSFRFYPQDMSYNPSYRGLQLNTKTMLGSYEIPNTGITESMENIESIVVHPFGDGLIVEIIGVGEKGDISIDSIEFDIAGDDREVSARGDIPSEYKKGIRAALSKKKYFLVE